MRHERDYAAEGRFPQTRWSVVLGAGRPGGERALAELCELYWAPVHAFLCRLGCSREAARDKAQGFFTRLLERGDLAKVQRAPGRLFRSWLCTCVKHYFLNELARERAAKRGGGGVGKPFEDERHSVREPFAAQRLLGAEEALDRIWDQCWAHTLVGRALERLSRHPECKGRAPLLAEVRSGALGEEVEKDDSAIAAELGIAVGSVRVYRFRVRRAFVECLDAELLQSADPPSPPAAGGLNDVGRLAEERARLVRAFQSAQGALPLGVVDPTVH
jgi:DNA-directed RNA polymerase specialized sigma24 family protein